MQNQLNAPKDLTESLRDAGCDDETIDQFLHLQSEGKTSAAFCLLSKHRQKLLSTVHSEENRISILDYLIYKLKKEGGVHK